MTYGDKSDPTHGMMFLDKNITNDHQERLTLFNIYQNQFDYRKHYLRYNNIWRPIHKTGSCLIDACLKEPDCRFLVYIDDPFLLEAEIEQCISSTPKEKVDVENKVSHLESY